MATNMLEQLTREISGNMVGKIAEFLGEGAPAVQKAVPAALSALIGGVATKGASITGASQLLDQLRSGGFGAETLSGMAAALSGGEVTKNFMERGRTLVSTYLGDRAGGIGDWLSSLSGLTKDKSQSLLALLAPFVLGMLGRKAKEDDLNAGGLMGLLTGQAAHLQQAAPAGLAGLLGLTSFASLGTGAVGAAQGAFATGPLAKLFWILVAIAVALLMLYVPSRCAMRQQVALPEIPKPAAVRVDPLLGAFGEATLPNGVKLSIPELGIERKLLAFIQDTGRPVDTTTWFTFDRLQFETGSAVLKPSSQEQLTNISEILKAYPQVAIKLGGYTDNVGNPQSNLKLSGDRANNTMQELVKLGIEPTRLEAEGYGEQHPVADNGTAEGRQQNRRIDVRVTRK